MRMRAASGCFRCDEWQEAKRLNTKLCLELTGPAEPIVAFLTKEGRQDAQSRAHYQHQNESHRFIRRTRSQRRRGLRKYASVCCRKRAFTIALNVSHQVLKRIERPLGVLNECGELIKLRPVRLNCQRRGGLRLESV